MSKEPLKVIEEFKEAGEYKLKGVSAPKYYLGSDLHQPNVDNYTCYKTHAKTYITCITDKIEKLMEWLLRSYMSPEDPNYSPELDKTPLLGPEQHLQYRMIIGSLNWLVTLIRLQHLPRQPQPIGLVRDGTTRRTPTLYKAHPWLPLSISNTLYLLQHCKMSICCDSNQLSAAVQCV